MKKENLSLIDVHSDVLMDIIRKRALGRIKVFEEDWVPAMRKAGLNLRVASIYIDEAFVPDMALRRALDMVSALLAEENESPSISVCRNFEDIEKSLASGKIGLILAFEGVEPLLNDKNLLFVFYKLGLRIMALTHSRRNFAGDGSLFSPGKMGKPGGLSEFGIELLQEAEELGILVDVTHLNDEGFWDVMEHVKSPVIATHSNCRSLCDHPRNLTDDQIKAVAERGGVIGVLHFCFAPKSGGSRTVDHILDHLDYVVKVAGVENVGFGFDFYEYLMKYLSEEEHMRLPKDAFVTSPSNNLTKDEDIPAVIEGLKKRGYGNEEIELISAKNFLRVFKSVWK
ncbi:MAG: dipeptidase [Candidatus Aminicenantes bacterium]|nr:MAG: dipeptidase [Candidatus Aminicenantes bacterium]